MGGARETVAKAKKTGKSEGSVVEMLNGLDIRYHESDGEVHFHDDKTPLKCAIPVAEFWDAWQSFKSEKIKEIHFFDIVHSTELKIKWTITVKYEDIDISISLKKINLKKAFSDMDAFMEGK